jgi:lipopolysaccharide export LptBFGC system permease protein LptF
MPVDPRTGEIIRQQPQPQAQPQRTQTQNPQSQNQQTQSQNQQTGGLIREFLQALIIAVSWVGFITLGVSIGRTIDVSIGGTIGGGIGILLFYCFMYFLGKFTSMGRPNQYR